MKLLTSREYVCTSGIGDRDASVALMNGLRGDFEGLYKAKTITGAVVHTIYNDAQMEEEGIDPEPVLRISEGKYPVVWAAVTFDPAVMPEGRLRDTEERFSCVLTKTHTQQSL